MILTLMKAYFQTKYLSHFRSREELEEWQHRQVIRHLQKVLPLSAFYRRLFDGVPLDKWKTIPHINKSAMMDHFDSLNTVGIAKEESFRVALEAEATRSFSPTIRNITIGLSSGTSGNRGLFIASPAERHRWAGTILAKALPGHLLQRESIALFLRANSNLYETMTKGHIQFQFYDLLATYDQNIEKLKKQAPTILAAPPSVLRMIAEACLDIHPKKVISIAEVLDPLDEVFLEKAFQKKIHQIYQCTEGFLGATCSFGTLHLNEDVICFQKEYLAPQKFVPIITDFRRTSQPIIRYRLDDILTEGSEPCPCGSVFTALKNIEGRCDDIFYLRSLDPPHLRIPIFPDYIRGSIADASPNILEYTAVQTSEEKIEISLRLGVAQNKEVEEYVHKSLNRLWSAMKCCAPFIEFTPYHVPYNGKKMRRVRRAYEPS